MILEAIEAHTVLFKPPGITIFLAQLVGLLFPDFGSFSLFDLLVLLTSIALSGYFNNAGVNNLAGFGENALIIQRLIESIEESFDHLFLDQGLTELPDRLAIGYLIADLQAKKPHEASTIGNLVFHLIIRKVVQALENENLEHHHSVKGWTSHFVPVLRSGEGNIEDRNEDIPVDMLFQLHQWIFQLGESLKQKVFVEKTKWVDVFHDSNDKMR